MPKVSIVVPVYNVEKYLDRCVQSLLSQTLKDIEIILVDDKSPDSSPVLCDRLAATDPRIKVIHKPVNEGLGMACNSGLDAATGEYVAFCDSDDWVDTEMYRTLYDKAIETHAQAVYTGLKRVDENGDISGYLPHRSEEKIYQDGNVLGLMLDMIASRPEERYDRTIQVSAKVAVYDRIFLADNNLRFVSERVYPSEDLIFNVSVLLVADTVVVLPDFFYNYFVNLKSISTTIKPLHFKNIIKSANLISSIITHTEQSEVPTIKDEFQQRLDRFLLAEARSQCGKIIHSGLSYKEKRVLLRNLHDDIRSISTIDTYPVNKLPCKYAVMHKLILHRSYAILILLLPRIY